MQNPAGFLLLAIEDAFTRQAILAGAIERQVQVYEVDDDFGLSVVIHEKPLDVVIVESSHASVDAFKTAEIVRLLKSDVKPLIYLICDSLTPFCKSRAQQAGFAGVFTRCVDDDGQVSINAEQILEQVFCKTNFPARHGVKIFG